MLLALLIYFTTSPPSYFPCLLFQTRYGVICFAKRFLEDRTGSVFACGGRRSAFFLTNYSAGNKLRACYTRSSKLASANSLSVPRVSFQGLALSNKIRRARPSKVRGIAVEPAQTYRAGLSEWE